MTALHTHAVPRKTDRRYRHPPVQLFSDQVRLVTARPNGTPGHYDALVGGELVVASTRTPFLDAARVLVERGCDTNSVLILRHAGSDTNCLVGKVGVAASLAAKEPDRGRVHLAPYVPFSSSPVAPPVAWRENSGAGAVAAAEARLWR